jgi:transposase
MSKRRSAYPLEFRRQMVELVRSGRDPEELSREFEPTARAIRNLVQPPSSALVHRLLVTR